MIRSVLPVGQGVFCVESFGHAKYVFDCGSITLSKSDLESLIKSQFFRNDNIDILFLSHLDADHVNGVDFLLSHCRVKKIYIPYLSSDAKIMVVIQNFLKQGGDGIPSFLKKIMSSEMSEDGVLVYTDSEKTTYATYSNNWNDLNIPSSLRRRSTIDWHFLMHNYENTKRVKMFISAIKSSSLLKDISAEELTNNWNRYEYDLRKIYKTKIAGDINTNSLVVYSGPVFAQYISKNIVAPHMNNDSAGCIYYGDYDAKGKRKYYSMIKRFNHVRTQVGTVILPHHGSKDNYNHSLVLDFSNAKFISSSGVHSIYHPHRDVLIDLCLSMKSPIIVNESSGSYDEVIRNV